MIYLQSSLVDDQTTTIKWQSCCLRLQNQDGSQKKLNLEELFLLSFFLALGLLPLFFFLVLFCFVSHVSLINPMIEYQSKVWKIFSNTTNHIKAPNLLLSPYTFNFSFLHYCPNIYRKLSINSIGPKLNLVQTN